MPRVSVVVPIYQVERYLLACLRSIARQTLRDIEVILVDDGSTDDGPAIAERFVAADPRFRLVRQDNRGLGAARNTGAELASGDHLAFVDSDDELPADAYERLLATLDATGSDFATGNVHRLTSRGTWQAPFLARAFAKNRVRTHVTRHRALLADRTACNKLWRRTFWDAHRLRFPEGVVHEDIPLVLPAHFAAGSVDVLSAPVYHYRMREEGAPSITQRRLDHDVLRDRLSAAEGVLAHLTSAGPRRARGWYQGQLAADDLRLHVNLLDRADAAYREELIRRAVALLADAPAAAFARLMAIDRLKWHLLLHGRADELCEVVAFHRERAAETAPVRVRGRWYGEYPFRGDRAVGVPAGTYRLGRNDTDLALRARVDRLAAVDGELVVEGTAYISGLGAADPQHRVRVSLVRRGGRRQVRQRLQALALPTRQVARPDPVAAQRGLPRDLSHAGFVATLDPSELAEGGDWVDGTWDLHTQVSTRGVRRRRARFEIDSAEQVRATFLPVGPRVMVRALVAVDGRASLVVDTTWARVGGLHLVHGDMLVLSGELRLDGRSAPTLDVRRRSDGHVRSQPLSVDRSTLPEAFRATVPLLDLAEAPSPPGATTLDGPAAQHVWDLRIDDGRGPRPVAMPDDVPARAWLVGERLISLVPTPRGTAALVEQEHALATARPVTTGGSELGPAIEAARQSLVPAVARDDDEDGTLAATHARS